MIRPEIVRKRLNKLDEYLEILYGLQRYSRDELLESPERYGSAERFLHLAIEATLDIGNHVIADEGMGMVESYADVPRLLAAQGVIPPELAERWVRMVGFRNLLVHAYADIDRGVVFEVLHNRLGDLEALRGVFAARL